MVQTSLHSHIIIYSNTTKHILILELTVPIEENIFQQHCYKGNKYAKLLDDVKMSHVFPVEVGSRAYVAKPVGYALQELGFKQSSIKESQFS